MKNLVITHNIAFIGIMAATCCIKQW